MAEENGSYAEKTIEVTTEVAIGFTPGTRLATEHGGVAVEALNVGDLLLTTSGLSRPIRQLGHHTIECRQHRDRGAVTPVRIAAHTFGKDRPARDLHVSAAHAICIDVMGEILIPAGALVNGKTITSHPVERVTYWHVELGCHDIVLAENLPAENYPDMGKRGSVSETEAATPARAARPLALHTDVCRPLITEGPLYALVRNWVERQAECLAAARGYIAPSKDRLALHDGS